MNKSPDAFRTISEVSDWLDTPAHVLRFWESKFTQIKPVKRAGGRRYYRPEDMALLAGIKTLLHEQGMTIKGVQKLLREKGVRHVAGLDLPDSADALADATVPLPGAPQDQRQADDIPVVSATAPLAAQQQDRPQAPPTPPAPMHASRPANLPPISMPPTAMPPASLPPTVRPADAGMASGPEPDPGTGQAFAQDPQQVAPRGATMVAPRVTPRPLPALPDERPAPPGLLSRIALVPPQTITARRARIGPVLERLATLRDRMAQDQA